MKPFKYYLEYLLVRLLEAIFSAPPLGLALRGGEALGMAAKGLMGRRDVLIVSNLSRAFPEKRESEIRAIADGVWKNIGRMAVEFIRSEEILTDDRVQIDGREEFQRALAAGKGVIVITPHYCNWEFTGIMIQRHIHPVVAIVRAMKNPRVERWLRGKRSSGGVPVILHKDAARATLRLLRGKGAVGILCDQNLYTGGIFANFFGRPAATTTLPALLHVRTGAPVVLVHSRRDADKWRLVLETVTFPQVDDEDLRVPIYTQTIHDAMERLIRARPEWWFWIHNRWKRSPEAPTPVPAR